jgi:hypothetical protein
LRFYASPLNNTPLQADVNGLAAGTVPCGVDWACRERWF